MEIDTLDLSSLKHTLLNIDVPDVYIPHYEDTVCGKMDRLQENIEKSNFTQEAQLTELEKIRYENMKLNAQVNTLNKLVDKQGEEIISLKCDLDSTKKSLSDFQKQYTSSNKHSFAKGIVMGFIPALIIFVLTILATKYGIL